MNKRTLITGLTALLLTAAPGAASAEGLLVDRQALTDSQWTTLTAQIQAARAETPEAFEAFDQVRLHLREMDARKRGPFAPVAARLRALGPNALMPMLEALAVQAEAVSGLADTAQTAWLSGLVEAVGDLRDERARPVLRAIVDGAIDDHHVLRSATKALALQADDASVARLSTLATTAGPKRHAALAGIGYARRVEAVRAIAQALAAGLPQHEAADAVRSLASAGNSWVWNRRGGDQGEPVRRLAAQTLVDAFVAYPGVTREAAGKALLVVDHPDSPSLVQQALQRADADLKVALAALSQRLARNPLRFR